MKSKVFLKSIMPPSRTFRHFMGFAVFSLTIASMLSFSGCVGSPSSPAPVQKSASPDTNSEISPSRSSVDLILSAPWYRAFIGRNHRRPVIEVVTFGKFGSRRAVEEQKRKVDRKESSRDLPPAFRNVPSTWIPCLDQYSANRLTEYYNTNGKSVPLMIRDPSSERVTFNMIWFFDLTTAGCINNLSTNALFDDEKKKTAMKRIHQARKSVVRKAWNVQGQLIQTGKVRIVAVEARGILSAERYFTMAHASSTSTLAPGHVQGADFLLEISRHLGRLVRIENNEVVWEGSLGPIFMN